MGHEPSVQASRPMLSLIGEILWPCSSEPRLFCYDILELRYFFNISRRGRGGAAVRKQYSRKKGGKSPTVVLEHVHSAHQSVDSSVPVESGKEEMKMNLKHQSK
jgi:hypothetical protein